MFVGKGGGCKEWDAHASAPVGGAGLDKMDGARVEISEDGQVHGTVLDANDFG